MGDRHLIWQALTGSPHKFRPQKNRSLRTNADQLSNFCCNAIVVAAGEACVRLRSSREIRRCGVSGRPKTQVLRLLRSRTQASPAATDCVMA